MADINKKRLQKQIKINGTIADIRKTVAQLERAKNQYIDKARIAKERGDNASYKLARSGLSATIGQVNKAREMLLNIEITNELRQMTDINADFLVTIAKIAKSINKINKSSNFAKLQSDIQTALTNVEKSQSSLDAFLSNTDVAFESIASSTGDIISERELDSIIDGEIAADSSADANSEIDQLLSKLANNQTEGKTNV